MSKDSDKFFTPKSIFRGTNADGSKFKVTEWEPGSLGEFTGDGSTIGYYITNNVIVFFIHL
jgi:hypothetical protein